MAESSHKTLSLHLKINNTGHEVQSQSQSLPPTMKVLCNKDQIFSHELAFTCVINMVKHPESTARSAKMFYDLKYWTDSVNAIEKDLQLGKRISFSYITLK